MTPEYFHAEFEINTHCDLRCFGCDRFLDIGPGPDMTVAQIEYFIKESIELNWPWERFHILGGEPTLHPQLEDICTLLANYRSAYRPNMLLRLLSNGYGNLEKCRKMLKKLSIPVYVEGKTPGVTPPYFNNVRLAPIDEELYKDRKEYGACGIHGARGCGLGVTRYGIFLCGAAGGICRVAGLDIGIKHLRDVTVESMSAQAEAICKYCGHWNSEERPHTKIAKCDKQMSPYWLEAAEKFKTSPPTLTVYGDET